MPYAVTLILDPDAASRVELMWRALAEKAGDDDAIRLGYAPHITFAVLPDTTSARELEETVRRATQAWDALPIVLAGLGVFPGAPSVIWVAPIVTERLLTQHAMLHTALAPYDVHSHYHPGAWVPHVTLSQRGLCPPSQAVELAASVWEGPIPGSLEHVHLVRFRPVEVLWGAPLRPSPLK